MTSELLNQINLKTDMYVECISQSTSIDIYSSRKINFKTFERTTKQQKYRHCQLFLYHDTFNCY